MPKFQRNTCQKSLTKDTFAATMMHFLSVFFVNREKKNQTQMIDSTFLSIHRILIYSEYDCWDSVQLIIHITQTASRFAPSSSSLLPLTAFKPSALNKYFGIFSGEKKIARTQFLTTYEFQCNILSFFHSDRFGYAFFSHFFFYFLRVKSSQLGVVCFFFFFLSMCKSDVQQPINSSLLQITKHFFSFGQTGEEAWIFQLDSVSIVPNGFFDYSAAAAPSSFLASFV